MVIWGAVVAFLILLVGVVPLRRISPFWLQTSAELLVVISVFALVYLLESSGNNAAHSSPAS
jgi:hypothetical protein